MRASTNGRPMTLDPVMERESILLPVVRVESSMAAGWRMDWLSASTPEGVEITLTAGAGVGSPYLVLMITHPELGDIEEVVDMRVVVQDWVTAAISAGRTPTQDGEADG